MKVVRLINQNIPIWSMLDGDHALKKQINKINPRLIKTPNFLDRLENQLRHDVFRRERGWILDQCGGDNPSFSIIEFSYKDLLTFNTCFTDISYERFLEEHVISIDDKHHQFSIDRKKGVFEKPKVYVKYMERFKRKTLDSCHVIQNKDIDDYTQLNSDDLWLATNRGIFVKNGSGSIEILDGTHRLTSYGLAIKDGMRLPKKLYGFYLEK